MSCLLTCDELNGMDWETILRSLIVLDDNGCFALRSTASGGGSYTFPANGGRIAYVATGGNDATGAVGNISKPFLTANAAITGLTAFGGANPGTLIILSSAAAVTISNYDYSSMVEELSIQVMCPVELIFSGNNCVFSTLNTISGNTITINTQVSFAVVDNCNIQCNAFKIKSTSQGSFDYFGTINCNYLVVEDNVNIACDFDTVEWSTSCLIGTVAAFDYNKINPRIWEGKVSQADTDPPTIDRVIENTINGTVTTAYDNVGEYRLICAGAFIPGFTSVDIGHINLVAIAQYGSALQGTITSAVVPVFSFDAFNAASNNILFDTDVTIKIWPEKY